jgi:hypothetical protein
MNFRLVESSKVDWERLDQFNDRTVFQTREWINFIAESQGATPVIAALCDSGNVVGFFSGLLFSFLGVRILGSPFPGWTTAYMGFNLLPHVSRVQALKALKTFAFQDLNCLHLEVSDRFISKEEGERLGFSCELVDTLITDLTQSEEKILTGMTRLCRQCIRKAEKSGVRIERAQDDDFAVEYYEQLRDVFGRQGVIPTYGLNRVKQLIRHMLPTGKLLLLRARNPQGECIATGIYVAVNEVEAFYWGNASFRHSQHYRPNELLNWSAMRYWKQQGLQVFDWGGADYCGSFKAKFGAQPSSWSMCRKSRFLFVSILREQAKSLSFLKRRLAGMVHSYTPAGESLESRRNLQGNAETTLTREADS